MSRNRKLMVMVMVVVVLCTLVMVEFYGKSERGKGIYKMWSQDETPSANKALEQDEDYSEILRAFLYPPQKCPKGRFLSVLPGGNLGNMIWEYMSLYVIAKLFGEKYDLVPYVNYELREAVETTFESLSIPTTNEVPPHCLDLNHALVVQLNQSFTFNLQEDTPIILGRYSARYEEVLRFGIENIKREMRFKRYYVEVVMTKLRVIRDHFQENDNVTFVGVHYRGTDYIRHLENAYNRSVDVFDLYKYYLKAMNYYKTKYGNVIFIFFSIDAEWTQKYTPLLRKLFNVVVNPNGDSRETDLALMAHCNHSIINYGTFGATAAYFAQGTTLVYDLKLPLDHRGATVAMGMAKMLDNWFLVP